MKLRKPAQKQPKATKKRTRKSTRLIGLKPGGNARLFYCLKAAMDCLPVSERLFRSECCRISRLRLNRMLHVNRRQE